MTCGEIQFFSKALGRHVTYTVFLPDVATSGEGPYPVLVQLHGMSDNHTAWMNRSNLMRYVHGLPLIVVMPDGALSFWANYSAYEMYEDFINEDLWEHMRSVYNVRDGKWAIGGLSMGGFGALYNALRHPDRFCSVWAHSSACLDEKGFIEAQAQRRLKLPEDVANVDLFMSAQTAVSTRATDVSSMRVTFDCGTEDFLIEPNRHFHRHLDEIGLSHTYIEYPGAHSWDYWDTHIKEALVQHAEALGIARKEA